MPLVTKPYNFVNQTTSDAGQVDQDFDTLYTLVNGGLDNANFKVGGITSNNLASGAVTPVKTEGLPFAHHLFGNGFIFSGVAVTKDGTQLNQIDVTAGVVYVKQADGTYKEYEPTATTWRTSTATNTYYLDFQPDGTFWWNTGHSQQSGYIPVATVTSDASSNVNVLTPNTNATAVTLLGGAIGPVNVLGAQTYNPMTNPLYRLGL